MSDKKKIKRRSTNNGDVEGKRRKSDSGDVDDFDITIKQEEDIVLDEVTTDGNLLDADENKDNKLVSVILGYSQCSSLTRHSLTGVTLLYLIYAPPSRLFLIVKSHFIIRVIRTNIMHGE